MNGKHPSETEHKTTEPAETKNMDFNTPGFFRLRRFQDALIRSLCTALNELEKQELVNLENRQKILFETSPTPSSIKQTLQNQIDRVVPVGLLITPHGTEKKVGYITETLIDWTIAKSTPRFSVPVSVLRSAAKDSISRNRTAWKKHFYDRLAFFCVDLWEIFHELDDEGRKERTDLDVLFILAEPLHPALAQHAPSVASRPKHSLAARSFKPQQGNPVSHTSSMTFPHSGTYRLE